MKGAYAAATSSAWRASTPDKMREPPAATRPASIGAINLSGLDKIFATTTSNFSDDGCASPNAAGNAYPVLFFNVAGRVFWCFWQADGCCSISNNHCVIAVDVSQSNNAAAVPGSFVRLHARLTKYWLFVSGAFICVLYRNRQRAGIHQGVRQRFCMRTSYFDDNFYPSHFITFYSYVKTNGLTTVLQRKHQRATSRFDIKNSLYSNPSVPFRTSVLRGFKLYLFFFDKSGMSANLCSR